MSPPDTPVRYVSVLITLDDLPAVLGVYAVQMVLPSACQVSVARRTISLPAGGYLYVGSARGSGGIRARLGRHLSGAGRPHWHIDALRGHAQIVGAYYAVSAAPLECRWIRGLLTLPDVTIPAPGFGASDCGAGCPAHLLLCAAPPEDILAALEAAALDAAP